MSIGIDPVIGKLGPFELRWYGLIMALAVLFGVWIMSRQLKSRGIPSHHVLGIAILGVVFGIIGARLVHVLDRLGYFIEHPGEILGYQMVGLAIYGVVGGGLVGLVIYCLWRKLPILRTIDATALAFPAGQIVGKSANIINGDTWGSPTDLPWGITYTNPDSFIPTDLLDVPTHPTPIYEQLWLLVVVLVLLLTMRRLMKVDGLAILAYAWLYSLGRFFITFYRANEPMLWGLKEAQLIALGVLVLAPPLAYWLVRRARSRPAPAPEA
jgi:phosphatidylglycerol:prolipoprotein diacylglycerol transferase